MSDRQESAEPSAGPLTAEQAREELRVLLGALRLETRRRADLGQASVPRPRKAAPAADAAPATQPEAPGRSAPAEGPASPPEPAPAAPSAKDGVPDAEAPVTRDLAQGAKTLEELAAGVANCTACGLCETRQQTVFSDGSPTARVMFVGEAPGADEDRTGVPFVGRAGQLLTDIVTKGMGLAREDVYIANILKCRPPENRDPAAEEKRLCTPFLERQIELVDPEVVIPLGRHAATHLLGLESSMGRLRGQVHERGGRKIVATYHPAYLLRTPSAKKDTWADIQLAMRELGLQRPEKSGGS